MMYVFWVIFFLIVYHYFLFPIITLCLAGIRNRAVKQQEIYPEVTLIIAAYNEERVIDEKITNSFELEYPVEKLDIIIVSDGSTDRTPEIVTSYQGKGIVGLFEPSRRGKTAALNRAVERASGEIVVFSDANSMYDRRAIKMLVRNFFDSSVGGVCGRKSIVENEERESSRGDSLFWNIESAVKIRQSRISSITTGDGEIFAIRRKLYSKIPEEIINDDTAITFNIIRQGYRVIYEPEAISLEEASRVLKDDFNVKARMVMGGYQTIAIHAGMLFPPRNFFAIQFISHKALRWIMPILLLFLLISNVFILHGFYLYFLWLQLAFHLCGIAGYLMKIFAYNMRIFYLPLYYYTMNLAALLGLIYFIKRKAGVSIWKKPER